MNINNLDKIIHDCLLSVGLQTREDGMYLRTNGDDLSSLFLNFQILICKKILCSNDLMFKCILNEKIINPILNSPIVRSKIDVLENEILILKKELEDFDKVKQFAHVLNKLTINPPPTYENYNGDYKNESAT